MSESVATFLEQSRAAHLALKAQLPRMQHVGGQVVEVAGNAIQARLYAEQALNLRLQALALDPLRTSPAWAIDGDIHDDIVTYLRHILTLER